MSKIRKAQIAIVVVGVLLALGAAPALAKVFEDTGAQPPTVDEQGDRSAYNSRTAVSTDRTSYRGPTGPCGGFRIFQKAIGTKYPGKPFGYLRVYYNSSTGKNCAKTISSSRTQGKKKPMFVGIYKCRTSIPNRRCGVVDDAEDRPTPNSGLPRYGRYSHYAGPVRVRARDHCIAAIGSIKWNGKKAYAATPHYNKSTFCD
ncbi:MAG: hypothetical protein WKF28_08175 [Rubrobacteraceae bacterium]